MNFTIKDSPEATMCATCRNALIMRGPKVSDEKIFCHWGVQPIKITFPVKRCSEYDDKRNPFLMELEKIAWHLAPGEGRKKVGFLSPEEWKKREKDD